MANIFKKSMVLNILIFISINIFLLDYYLPIMLYFHIPTKKYEELLNNFSLVYICFVTINRLYLLPIYFKFLLKNTKRQEIKFFIQELKLSFCKKMYLLIFTFFVSPILTIIIDAILNHNYSMNSLIGSFKSGLIFAPYIGLYQPYLILFFYWWLEDYCKTKYKKSRVD